MATTLEVFTKKVLSIHKKVRMVVLQDTLDVFMSIQPKFVWKKQFLFLRPLNETSLLFHLHALHCWYFCQIDMDWRACAGHKLGLQTNCPVFLCWNFIQFPRTPPQHHLGVIAMVMLRHWDGAGQVIMWQGNSCNPATARGKRWCRKSWLTVPSVIGCLAGPSWASSHKWFNQKGSCQWIKWAKSLTIDHGCFHKRVGIITSTVWIELEQFYGHACSHRQAVDVGALRH